jgi:hypothetical protein
MPAKDKVEHSNRYLADLVCGHCDGVIRYEPWCMTQSSRVLYACQILADPFTLNTGDRFILHALGVSWTARRLR